MSAHPHLRRLDIKRMLVTEPPPVDYIIEDIAARGHVTLIYGREKEGKSLIMQSLAITVATGGGSQAGMKCKPGVVAIVDAENGENVVHRRIRGMRFSPEHADNWHVYEAYQFDLRQGVAELRAILDETKPDLLVLDSFRSLWGGDEDRSAEAAAVLEPLLPLAREYSTAIVLIHHSKKDGTSYRGSGGIGSTVEHKVEIMRLEDDDDRHRRRLRFKGTRFDEEPEERWLRIERDTDGLLLVDEAEPFAGADEKPKRDAPVRRSLMQEIKNVLTFEPQSQAAILQAVGRNRDDRPGREAIKELVANGEADRSGDTWHLPPLGATGATRATRATSLKAVA